MMSTKLPTALCRVCLQSQTSKGLSLFENYKHAPIFEHINLLTKLEIKEGDGLPQKICTMCLLELEAVLNFTLKCRNSDFILRNNPGDIKIELPLENDDQEDLIKDEEPDDEPVYYDDTGVDDDIYESILTDDIIPEKPGNPEFECHDCGNIFKSKCKIRVHWKKVHLPEQLICKICKKQCRTYRSLHSHIKKNSSYCKLGLKVNIEGVGKKRVYICKDCNYKTLRPNSMKFHLHTHSNERPYFVCKICHKTYTQAGSLSGHMESAHKQYKQEITCQFCGKHVKGRASVYRHLRTHQFMNLKCEVCSAVLKSKKIYDTHMLRHSGNKSFTCEICAKSFYTLGELCTHKRYSHSKKLTDSENKIFSCSICDFKCRQKITLKKHTHKHTDSNVCCVKCGFFFDSEELWRKHQKCHTNLNHECPHCGKGFFSKRSVGEHIRRVHSYLTSANKKPRREKACLSKETNILQK